VLRIDSEMMEALEKWAADEFRSVNGQIQYVLDQALRKAGRTPKTPPLKGAGGCPSNNSLITSNIN